jgi:hypothetical protein
MYGKPMAFRKNGLSLGQGKKLRPFWKTVPWGDGTR